MAEWFWNSTVTLHEWLHSLTGSGSNTMNVWLIVIGIVLLIAGAVLHYLAAARSGIDESMSDESDGKSTFFLLLAYVLFPVDVAWCDYDKWSKVSGAGHFFAWVFFIFFACVLLIKVLHVFRLLFNGYYWDALFKLLSILMIYLGVVIFSGLLGTIIVIGFLIVALLSPSGGHSSGGGYGGGGGYSGPQPPDHSSGSAGDREYHDGAQWEHDGSWSGDPWHRV